MALAVIDMRAQIREWKRPQGDERRYGKCAGIPALSGNPTYRSLRVVINGQVRANGVKLTNYPALPRGRHD